MVGGLPDTWCILGVQGKVFVGFCQRDSMNWLIEYSTRGLINTLNLKQLMVQDNANH